VHRGFLNALATERDGGKTLPAPMAARMAVAELLDDLEADFRLRGVKWWAQAKYHAQVVRDALGTFKASKLTPADVDRYIEAQQREKYSDASINRQTGLLRQALRLARKRGTLTNLIEVRRLPEHYTRQGFFERSDLEAVVAALPEYLQDFTRFGYLTAWRRGELATLTWADVDRTGGVIRLRPEHSKNGRGRTVAIEGDLGAIIERRAHARVIPGRNGGRIGWPSSYFTGTVGRSATSAARGRRRASKPAFTASTGRTRMGANARYRPDSSTTCGAAACATWCGPASGSAWRWRSAGTRRAPSSTATTS